MGNGLTPSVSQATRLKGLVQHAGLRWEAFQLPVRGDVCCIGIPCDRHEIQALIERLFGAVKTIEDPAHREEIIMILGTLQTEAIDGERVVVYWPTMLVVDLR